MIYFETYCVHEVYFLQHCWFRFLTSESRHDKSKADFPHGEDGPAHVALPDRSGQPAWIQWLRAWGGMINLRSSFCCICCCSKEVQENYWCYVLKLSYQRVNPGLSCHTKTVGIKMHQILDLLVIWKFKTPRHQSSRHYGKMSVSSVTRLKVQYFLSTS